MEMICPDCQGTLETTDGQTARCPLHGAEFRILFSHWQPPPAGPAEEFVFQPAGDVKLMCAAHPSAAATAVCARCGAPICDTCSFPAAEGRKVCVNCVTQEQAMPAGPVAPAVPPGSRCLQHPSVEATQKCHLCGAFMCPTCDFALPGNVHVCPVCAAAPRVALSPRRRKCMLGSYAMAVIAMLGTALAMSGILVPMVQSQEANMERGLLLMFFGFGPALAGMAMGFTAVDRRLTNPMSLWIATIWNTVMVAAYVLLMLVGILRQ
jgi:hypothetical protein